LRGSYVLLSFLVVGALSVILRVKSGVAKKFYWEVGKGSSGFLSKSLCRAVKDWAALTLSPLQLRL